jgi:hypothetical protein
MEHRWSSRQDINSTITVRLQHYDTIKAEVKNVSRTGMLLDTREVNIARGTIVELVYAHESETVSFRALAIHGGDGLAGIMFIEHAGKFTALLDTLNTAAEHVLPAMLHDSKQRSDEVGHGISGHGSGYASA